MISLVILLFSLAVLVMLLEGTVFTLGFLACSIVRITRNLIHKWRRRS